MIWRTLLNGGYRLVSEQNSLGFECGHIECGGAGRFTDGGCGELADVAWSGRDGCVAERESAGDEFTASPVSLGDELYLRGARYLYCVAKP